MKRAALYIRVSTEEQARNGYSLGAQLEDLKLYAQRHHYTVIDVYADEGASARKRPFKRKEFQRLMEDVKQNRIDVIVFIKLDRWFRSVADYYKAQEILDKYSIQWETTQEQYNTTTTNGRLMLNIKLAVAQNESDMTSDRIKFVFSQKMARGEVCSGSVPLGYKIVNKHIVKSDQSYIIEDLYQHYLQHHSLGEALRYLQHQYNIDMHPESVKRLLTTELFTGRAHGNDNYAERIIDDDTWNAVQNIIKSNGNIKYPPSGRIYLFSGLLICPECGRKLAVVSSQLNKNGSRYVYYRCPAYHQSHCCTNSKNYPEKRVEEALLNTLDNALQYYIITIQQEAQKPLKQNSNISVIKKKLSRLKELYVNELIDIDTYKHDYESLNQQLIPRMPKPAKKVTPLLQSISQKGSVSIYEKLNRSSKRDFWHQLLDHIDFNDKNPIIFFK